LNADICFVPLEHATQEGLPAVSGSSGRLLVQEPKSEAEDRHWPGQIFANADLLYEEAMQSYIQATRDRLEHGKGERNRMLKEPSRWRQWVEARTRRYQVMQCRKQEDLDWKAAKLQYRQTRLAHQQLSRQERQPQPEAWQVIQNAWHKLRQERRNQFQVRYQENAAWHQSNQQLQADPAQARQWLAILVITDNCTRQSLGLPVFATGPKMTSQELVAALQAILPKELRYFISDQGALFRTSAFAQFAKDSAFIHVPVYRHRPQSNGIAERFVLTLKTWLRDKAWQSADALRPILARFVSEYNDRPHQGLAIPGLSPNEFANRIWLM
jgi:transposase InsO family protein